MSHGCGFGSDFPVPGDELSHNDAPSWWPQPLRCSIVVVADGPLGVTGEAQPPPEPYGPRGAHPYQPRAIARRPGSSLENAPPMFIDVARSAPHAPLPGLEQAYPVVNDDS